MSMYHPGSRTMLSLWRNLSRRARILVAVIVRTVVSDVDRVRRYVRVLRRPNGLHDHDGRS